MTVDKEKKESEQLEKIQLKHLIIAFLILGVGWFVALIVFVCEMMGKKMVHKSAEGQHSENQNMERFSSD